MGAVEQNPDRSDVRRVLAGDTDAFGGIVGRWQGPLVNLAYRYCRDAGRAEELAQEAFLRAFRYLGRWREDAAFSTWLFAVAINVYRSELRRVRPRELPLDAERERATIGDPLTAVESDERSATVRRAVTMLPAKYRDTLVMFYFREMDVAATARQLGVAEGTVKARLNRGRALLERRLTSGFGSRKTLEAT